MAEGGWVLWGVTFDGFIIFMVFFVVGSVVALLGGKMVQRHSAGSEEEKEGQRGHALTPSKSRHG